MKNRKSLFVFCLFGAVQAVACKIESKSDSSKDNPTASTSLDALKNQIALDMSDVSFDTASNTAIDKDVDLLSTFSYTEPPRLNYIPENKKDDDSDAVGKEFVNCYFDKLAKGSKLTHVESGFLLSGKADISDCYKLFWGKLFEGKSETKYEILESNVTTILQVHFVCPGGDAASIKGLTVEEFFAARDNKADICKNAPNKFLATRSSTNMNVKTKSTTPASSLTPATELVTVMHYNTDSIESTKDGKPCTSTREGNTVRYAPGCLKLEKTKFFDDHSDAEEKGKTRTSLFEFLEGLESEFKDPEGSWYSKGALKFFSNGWNGTVNYTGTESAPKLTATMGDKKIDKELGAKASTVPLNLTESASSGALKLPKIPKLF